MSVPEKPSDPREQVLRMMLDMSRVEWTPEEDIDLSYIKDALIYRKGVVYNGIIYAFKHSCTLEEFTSRLRNGVYVGPTDKTGIVGNSCSSALINCWKTVYPALLATNSYTLLPLGEGGTLPVGEYVIADSDASSGDVVSRSGRDVIYRSYAFARAGDALVSAGGEQWKELRRGHTRMVMSVSTAEHSDGRIDPARSFVTTLEQTSRFDRFSDLNSTWWVGHEYSFADLCVKNYLPVTLPVFG